MFSKWKRVKYCINILFSDIGHILCEKMSDGSDDKLSNRVDTDNFYREILLYKILKLY